MPKLDLVPIPTTQDIPAILAYLDTNFKRIQDLLKLQLATADIADDAITSAKIAADAVGSSEIAAGAVGLSELDDVTVDQFLCPTGAVLPFADDTVPTGWLLCDGQAVSRTTYSALWNLIGTTYGAGDGSTTFNVPNMKGRVPVGRDAGDTDWDVLGETRGAKTHTLVTAEMPGHTHGPGLSGTNFVKTGGTGTSANLTGGGAADNLAPTTTSTGGDGAHNNLQPSIVLNYIIKY